ncbi:hypothetical protein HY090_00500 [Candidatus Kaiserbacteria bacterium]|nr:hypothetical protein [Candidatus Kaiserbacteria bacterium]
MRVGELKKNETLHHGYIVSGSAEHGAEEVLKMLEERKVATKGNPDLLTLSFSEMLVDDVRDKILSFAALKPLASFSRANDAAQNALLKAVEESLGNTVFFFCVDSAGHLLPTLRSRCITLEAESYKQEAESQDAEEFLRETYEKRLARVEKMTGYISKTQDRAPARAFATALISLMHERAPGARTLRDLLDADRYLRLQGSSAKSILGHLAVSLPR